MNNTNNTRISPKILKSITTPTFIIDELLLEQNLQTLNQIQKSADCTILLALKGYATHSTFPLIRQYLNGTCAGSLHEAKLGKEAFQKKVHTYSPAFTPHEFPQILNFSDYLTFNSPSQLNLFLPQVQKYQSKNNKIIPLGLRVNPETSVASEKYNLYDPCTEHSRLGTTLTVLKEYLLEQKNQQNFQSLSGLHFHALCEQNADALETIVNAVEEKFSPYLNQMNWVNFGGGHHLTRNDYNQEKLAQIIKGFKQRHSSIQKIYLEPGEAIALNTGYLVTSVLDIIQNGTNLVLLDTSAEAHFSDILLTRADPQPFIPEILGAGIENEHPYNYIIGGTSCAAGDVFGKYSFPKPLKIGDKLIFLDAAHYTIVKTNTFNGINLPSIALLNKQGNLNYLKKFGYDDYYCRLS